MTRNCSTCEFATYLPATLASPLHGEGAEPGAYRCSLLDQYADEADMEEWECESWTPKFGVLVTDNPWNDEDPCSPSLEFSSDVAELSDDEDGDELY